MKETQYELCEKCEKELAKLGMTTEEMVEQQAEFDFGLALKLLKEGHKVARKGWNGKGMWLKLIPAGNAMYQGYPMQDCIGMKTANSLMQPGWLASQADMLADDWVVLS